MLAGHCFWAGGDGVVLGSRLVAWASRHCLWSGKDRMSDHRGDTPNLGGPGGAVGIGQMPRVGSQFASYRIEGVLGRGGMSVVYRAENMRLGNEVALKVLSADLSEDDAFRERFVRESRLAASINHPNIIPIYDAGEQDGLLYIAMRYVEGCDLKTLIREQGPLSLPRARRHHLAGRPRSGRRPSARPDPPRHQAGEHPHRTGGRRARGARPRLPGRLRPDEAHDLAVGADQHRPVPGHGRLRRARAGGGAGRRPPGRHLLAGLRALRMPDRLRALPARCRRCRAVRPCPGRGAAGHRRPPRPAPGGRRDHLHRHGQAPR